ncbi:MAG: hypothetical protein AAGA83_21330 [Cyanobacteria bacterium P01_F01_bin.116]
MGAQLLSSLILTLVICFIVPAVGLGVVFAALVLGAWSPLSTLSEIGKDYLVTFLLTFGAGDIIHGVVIICLTVSIVGGLFDLFTVYKHLYLNKTWERTGFLG